MAHCSAMICQQVTLSGDAEWPKVADAVIEAPYRDKCHGPLLASGRYQDEAQCDINLGLSPLLEHYRYVHHVCDLPLRIGDHRPGQCGHVFGAQAGLDG